MGSEAAAADFARRPSGITALARSDGKISIVFNFL
jgi:hypothetical protein